MHAALAQAQAAQADGEIPVGAVVVQNGSVIGIGRNSCIHANDPCAHAEIMALRAAAQHIGNYRLDDCTLYVTLEPCPMCMGAAINARVGRLVFACRDPKAGAAVSLYQLGHDERLNHRMILTEGVRRAAASRILTGFFASLRSGERVIPEIDHDIDVPLTDVPAS